VIERRTEPEAKGQAPQLASPASAEVAGARLLLASWLRGARQARGMSLADVTKVTKIQARTLEHLEHGRFDQLPADVFVRGFVRSYARCVGLDPDEAVRRYGECGKTPGPAAAAAHALLDSMAELAPATATVHVIATARPAPQILVEASSPAIVLPVEASGPVPASGASTPSPIEGLGVNVETATVEVAVQAPKRKRKSSPRKKGNGRRLAKGTNPPQTEPIEVSAEPLSPAELAATDAVTITVEPDADAATDTAAATVPAAAAAAVPASVPAAAAAAVPAAASAAVPATASVPAAAAAAAAEPVATTIVTPPPAVAPIRFITITRPRVTASASIPRLVIDDADPETAADEQDARADADEPAKRSFLPQSFINSLLDGEKPRQGGLTLAVIILLIAATLTLSYLMRRPSSGGEGITALPPTPTHIA
jgi:cytoskeleton protein RodZ